MDKTKVYFVGAGPGNPGLLTLRAAKVLRQVDVVLYDNLITKEILETIPKYVKKIYVGKRPGRRSITQKEIIERIVSLVESGKVVGRLKGGDALFFSRGSEEARAMKQKGIPFEVVPGVSSLIGATSYAGIPLTHRDYSSSILVATGEEGKNHPRRLIWKNVSKSSADTIVLLMGARRLPNIATELIQGGMPENTPVAAVRWGTTAKQETTVMTLKEASEGKKPVKPPTVVVIGNVVTLMNEVAWLHA